MKTFSLKILFFILILVCSHTRLLSQQMISRSVFGCGGEISMNSSYRINGTLGQTLIGKITGTVNQKRIGFLYTIESIKVGVNELQPTPATFLMDNFPNPFTDRTTIRFSIEKRETVVMNVFDVFGRKVATILNGELDAGDHTAVFDRRVINASHGRSQLYFCTLTAGGVSHTQAIVALK